LDTYQRCGQKVSFFLIEPRISSNWVVWLACRLK
jgi:hypothetical protein